MIVLIIEALLPSQIVIRFEVYGHSDVNMWYICVIMLYNKTDEMFSHWRSMN